MQRIGVFVCHCGTNIAATVDVKAVAEALGHEAGVVISQDYQYMCSEAGQLKIVEAMQSGKIALLFFLKSVKKFAHSRKYYYLCIRFRKQ